MDEFRKIDKNLIEHVASGQEIRITGRELQDVEFTPPGGNHTNPTGEYLQRIHNFCRRPDVGIRQ